MKKLVKLLAIMTMGLSTLAASAQRVNLNIVFIGNSITYGANLDSPKTQAPPVYAAAYLSKRAVIGKVDYSNQGHSGYTTVDFLPGSKALLAAEDAARAFTNQQALLIFSIDLGTNDSAIKGPNGSPVTPRDYKANLKLITDELLKTFPTCIAIIHHPIWYSPNTYNGAIYLQEGLDRLQTYFPEIDGLANDCLNTKQLIFVGDTEAFAYFKKNYLTDLTPERGHQGTFYLHPNKKGAKVLGVFWAKAIIWVVTSRH